MREALMLSLSKHGRHLVPTGPAKRRPEGMLRQAQDEV